MCCEKVISFPLILCASAEQGVQITLIHSCEFACEAAGSGVFANSPKCPELFTRETSEDASSVIISCC